MEYANLQRSVESVASATTVEVFSRMNWQLSPKNPSRQTHSGPEDYNPAKFHLNNSNCTGWNIESAPKTSRIEAKYLPSSVNAGYGEAVLRILYSNPWQITGRIGEFNNEIIPFEVISMDRRQRKWLLQEKDAGGMLAIEVQVALDGNKERGTLSSRPSKNRDGF
ncbi:hypothetical protein GCK72_011482 [Caenorhabditis remanei]|uniref:Uncharacterized protein n=1 Tax=Caenorhabditis remanei TaxID=31234 RepID=A0A6A5H8L5_CAERE|nr:hypothetical protein GCK72_011482 [Caenorhabditis remanei]KAF1763216.1 hypothetical protein GCK72_011482 [Caenorhabditis remanei]